MNTDPYQFQARAETARCLIRALNAVRSDFSEAELANAWKAEIAECKSLLPFGWYQPPPSGVSVLIGTPPDYSRLKYRSLRDSESWPRDNIRFGEDAIVYPYFSSITADATSIGDFVGSFYSGNDVRVWEWIRPVYSTTKRIALSVSSGIKFSELHERAQNLIAGIGGYNNTYSQSGGYNADIGHTVPVLAKSKRIADYIKDNQKLCDEIAKMRQFVSLDNHNRIQDGAILTIEPQIYSVDKPMISFHFMVQALSGTPRISENFEELFDYFRMKL